MRSSHAFVMFASFQAPFVATSVGAALTLVVRRYGLRFRWCGVPLIHHTHTRPVPRLGGIAVYLAILTGCVTAGLVFGFRALTPLLPILLAVLPVLAVGAYDDLRHASPKTKIIAQLLGAAILLGVNWILGTRPTITDAALLVVWLVGTTNSFNLIDGVDGLASGAAIVIGLGLAAMNFTVGSHALGALSLIIVAACMGFLPFNVSGPRIFLGDCGSLSLGFLLAATAFATPHTWRLPFAAVLLFGYPLTETTYTIVRRTLKGRRISQPDREHFHHKLRNSGLSVFQTVSVLCLISSAFVSLGVMFAFGASPWLSFGCAAVLFLTVGKSFGYLGWRSFAKLKHLLRRASEDEELPSIIGYLPYK